MDQSIREEIRTQVERAVDRKFEEFRNTWLQGRHSYADFSQTFGTTARRESTLADSSVHGRTERGELLMQTKEQVYEYAQHLERYAIYLPDPDSTHEDTPVFAHLSDNVGDALIRWLEMPGSRFLWVDDLPTDPQNGVLTTMSMQICSNAFAAGLPVVLFFRRSHYSFQPQLYISAEHAGMLALLYSLILQFINLLPSSFQPKPALSEETFRRLDGSIANFEPALQILDSLLDHAPLALICVIDGLEELETPVTVDAIGQLVNTLRKQSEGRRFKVLFTTTGKSYVLSRELPSREQVPANRTPRVAGGPSPRGTGGFAD
ncbi:hypothetical protein F5Y05DRAFT_419658 [Hypoxylon sp. FL0543]|nr:hypothetical protein F5Y05DRAFT_419658 [Hypoxylon sp. FL0543]